MTTRLADATPDSWRVLDVRTAKHGGKTAAIRSDVGHPEVCLPEMRCPFQPSAFQDPKATRLNIVFSGFEIGFACGCESVPRAVHDRATIKCFAESTTPKIQDYAGTVASECLRSIGCINSTGTLYRLDTCTRFRSHALVHDLLYCCEFQTRTFTTLHRFRKSRSGHPTPFESHPQLATKT